MRSDEEIKRLIADRIRAVRELNHLTQKEAGRLIKVEQETWANYKRGVRGVDSVVLVKIAEAFKEPIEFFTDPNYRGSIDGKIRRDPKARTSRQGAKQVAPS